MTETAPERVWRLCLTSQSIAQYISGPTELDLWGPQATQVEYVRADRIAAQQAVIDDLVEALGKLCFELGSLQAFEAGVRHEIGNTNYAAIMARLELARSAIARAKG